MEATVTQTAPHRDMSVQDPDLNVETLLIHFTITKEVKLF